MVRGDLIIRIYRRLAKKRYLRGIHTYEYERIYVPIPSRLHDIVGTFINQRLKISITRQNDGLTITAHAYFFGNKDKEVNFRLVSGTPPFSTHLHIRIQICHAVLDTKTPIIVPIRPVMAANTSQLKLRSARMYVATGSTQHPT